MDLDRLRALTATAWATHVLETLEDYGRIPCLSPMFDDDWDGRGLLAEAAGRLRGGVQGRIDGAGLGQATAEVVRLPGLTPTLVVDVPASDPAVTGTTLCYGHYDKQPP